jgi:hypothetical protein
MIISDKIMLSYIWVNYIDDWVILSQNKVINYFIYIKLVL